MDLRVYAEFVGFAVVVTLAGGARRSRATAFGISTSNACKAARSALRPGAEPARVELPRAHGFRQGFASSRTSPTRRCSRSTSPCLALTHAVLGLVWLASTGARRVLDGVTSLFLAGFAGRLVLERT